MDEINEKLEDPITGSSNYLDSVKKQWGEMLETLKIPNERIEPKTREEFNKNLNDSCLAAAEIGYHLSVFGEYPDWYIKNNE